MTPVVVSALLGHHQGASVTPRPVRSPAYLHWRRGPLVSPCSAMAGRGPHDKDVGGLADIVWQALSGGPHRTPGRIPTLPQCALRRSDYLEALNNGEGLGCVTIRGTRSIGRSPSRPPWGSVARGVAVDGVGCFGPCSPLQLVTPLVSPVGDRCCGSSPDVGSACTCSLSAAPFPIVCGALAAPFLYIRCHRFGCRRGRPSVTVLCCNSPSVAGRGQGRPISESGALDDLPCLPAVVSSLH